jgi:hypothetical protein
LVQTCNDVPKENRIRKVFADVLHEKRCINMVYVYPPYDLKTTARTVQVPLRADEIQCRVSEHLAIGTKVDRPVWDKLDGNTPITAFVSKT